MVDKVDANCTFSEEWPKDGGKEFLPLIEKQFLNSLQLEFQEELK